MDAPFAFGGVMYWQPIPYGWRDAPAVVALASAIRKRDPRIFLIDLWDWAFCHGREHPAASAPDAIERGAGWRGKAGVLYRALVATGWVREQEGVATVVRWQDVVRGRATPEGVVPAGDVLLPEEKARLAARTRKQRSRENNSGKRDASVTGRDVSQGQRDMSRDGGDGVFLHRPETPVKPGIVTPIEVELEPELDNKKTTTLAPPENPASAATGVGELFPVAKRRGRPPKDASPEATEARRREKEDGERWMARARALVGLSASEAPWSAASWMAFRRAREKRGIDQLMRALDGLEGDTWASQLSPGALLSANVIEKGLARGKQGRGQSIEETWNEFFAQEASS